MPAPIREAKAAKRKPVLSPRRAPVAPPGVDRTALLAALREKAKALGACPVPAGQTPEIAARLQIDPSGRVTRVEWRNARLPPELDHCYRHEILGWRLQGMKLSQKVTVLVSLELTAR